MFINEKKKHAPFESRNFRNNIIITLYCRFVNETNNKKEKMENRSNSWNFTNNWPKKVSKKLMKGVSL